MRTLRYVVVFTLALLVLGMAVSPAMAKAGFGNLFYDGDVVRTVVPPASAPKKGRDNLYVIPAGAEGQLPVAAVGPGDQGYHGGKWAVHIVTWQTTPSLTPYLLTSEAAVLEAAAQDHVMIERNADADFKCPIQP